MKTLDTVPAPDFASLPLSRKPWGSVGVSFVIQAALLVAITKTTISFVAPMLNPVDTQQSVPLVAPSLKPPPPLAEPMAAAKRVPTVPRTEVPLPKASPTPIQVPKERVEVAKVLPPPVVKTDTSLSPPLVATKAPRPIAPTDFDGSSAPATVNKPIREVQTGGFGDPNGVPANPNSTGKGPAIAKVGSFDLPTGPGSGNGSGGSTGTRGTVASTTFGSGIATEGEGPSSGQKKVASTNFGSSEPVSDIPKRRVAAVTPTETPVSVLTKPTPNYTSEARQRKIEGDVELDVEFSATGHVHVIRVLQGLGYGLDEAAIKAAENIRFAPARRDGQAVDAHGRLRIVFRLS